MWDQVEAMLSGAALRMVESVTDFLPGLLGLIVILLGSFIVAYLVRTLVLKALVGIRFDHRAEQWGFGALVDWPGSAGPSR